MTIPFPRFVKLDPRIPDLSIQDIQARIDRENVRQPFQWALSCPILVQLILVRYDLLPYCTVSGDRPGDPDCPGNSDECDPLPCCSISGDQPGDGDFPSEIPHCSEGALSGLCGCSLRFV